MRYQVLPELYIVHSSCVNCLSRERFLTIVQRLLIRKLGIIFFDRGTTCQVGQMHLLMDHIVWVTFNLQCFLPYLRVMPVNCFQKHSFAHAIKITTKFMF